MNVWLSGRYMPESHSVLPHILSLSLCLSISRITLHTHYALTPFSFSPPPYIRYQEFVGDHKPARAVVPVPHLHYGFQLELEAVAML
jgi:hypothetical protein